MRKKPELIDVHFVQFNESGSQYGIQCVWDDDIALLELWGDFDTAYRVFEDRRKDLRTVSSR